MRRPETLDDGGYRLGEGDEIPPAEKIAPAKKKSPGVAEVQLDQYRQMKLALASLPPRRGGPHLEGITIPSLTMTTTTTTLMTTPNHATRLFTNDDLLIY